MGYIKIQEYSKAEVDCNECLSINKGHSKSLYRRGLARRKLRKYHDALKVTFSKDRKRGRRI